MGTASQSFKDGDPREQELMEELLKLVQQRGADPDRKTGLEQHLRASIHEAIFGRQADPITKNRVKQAVQGRLMDDIIKEFKKWKDAGEDPAKWPFPKKAV
jgi:thioesterase domain-containing protein